MMEKLEAKKEEIRPYCVCPVCGMTAKREPPERCPVCGVKGEIRLIKIGQGSRRRYSFSATALLCSVSCEL